MNMNKHIKKALGNNLWILVITMFLLVTVVLLVYNIYQVTLSEAKNTHQKKTT